MGQILMGQILMGQILMGQILMGQILMGQILMGRERSGAAPVARRVPGPRPRPGLRGCGAPAIGT
jgi:hypothetical protein